MLVRAVMVPGQQPQPVMVVAAVAAAEEITQVRRGAQPQAAMGVIQVFMVKGVMASLEPPVMLKKAKTEVMPGL